MKHLRSILAMAVMALASMFMSAPAAATVLWSGTLAYPQNVYLLGVNALTAPYANATTTPTNLVGTEVTVPATVRQYALQSFRVCWSADVTKSTSTTGAIGVFVNGAVPTDSYRYAGFGAGRIQIGGCYFVARASNAAQTISLYGVSGDTASFAVTNAQISVEVVMAGG